MKVIPAAFRAVFAIATVLGIHTGAVLAQQPAQAVPDPTAIPDPAKVQEPAPPQPAPPPPQPGYPEQQGYPQAYPPGYAPPPGYVPPRGYAPPPGYVPPAGYGAPPPAYGPPPPRYSYYPPPPPPVPPRLATERPFMIGGSLGLGGMRYHDFDNLATSGPATGYSARLGFGLGPRLLLLVGADGAIVDSSYVFNQTVYYLGLQAFLTRQVFLRGGAGIGNITGKDPYGDFLNFGKVGFGVMGSVGIELLQGYNWSLELAGAMTSGFYRDNESWTSGTVNIGFNFF